MSNQQMNQNQKNCTMKDSGVEWLGEIPTYWNVVKYKTFAKSGMGETILAKELTPQGIPVYSATQDLKVFGYYQNPKKILLKGDFIIPARGSVGYMHQILDDIATCTQTTIFSKIKNDDIHLRYIYFCGQALGEYWFEYDKTTVPQLTVSQVQNNLVPIPPLHEQQAIANYLDEQVGKMDRLISEQKQAIEKWKAYKQSLITETVTKGLNPNVEMKDSGIEWIGDIPKAWVVKKTKYLLNSSNGTKIGPFGSSLKLEMMNENYPYKVYGQENITKNSFTYGSRYINKEKFIELLNYQLLPKDIIVSTMGTIGRCKIVPEDLEIGIMDSHLIRIRLNSQMDVKYFEYIWDKSSILKTQLELESKGSIMAGLNSKIIRNTLLVVPPLHEQQQIADFLDEKCSRIDQTIEQKQELIKQLEEYKQSLIYECVTGKREVR